MINQEKNIINHRESHSWEYTFKLGWVIHGIQYLQCLGPTQETWNNFMLISFQIRRENEYNNEYVIMNLAWIVFISI